MKLRDLLIQEAIQKVDERIKAFWNQVKHRGHCQEGMDTPCWEWVGNTSTRERGQFWIGGKQDYCHRIAWQLSNGPITDGLHVLHRCDNPPCVRPDHLFLGTHQDNMKDRDEKGRGVTPKGSGHGMAKLTEDQIPVIRSLRLEGLTYLKIAERFGVSKDMIYRICKGMNWSHV